MTNLIGTYLGQYRLVELVRPGGMSMVYKAQQESLDRFVAVKVLSSNRDPQFAARFKREARAIAALQHHNILPVYDYGEQDQLLFLVMQYVENGVTLGDILGKPLLSTTALRLTSHVLDALDYAHKRGVIHRDIKPANVLMPTPNWPMLADFGIAKLMNDNNERLTGVNQIIGTAAYMAPEQVVDRPIDARTDLYAAGVVLYELVTGRVPFDSDTPVAVLTKHVIEPPPPPRTLNPDIPVPVEAVLLRALAKDPAARYQTAADMAAELRSVANQIERDGSRSQVTDLYEIGVQALEEGKWDIAVERLGQIVEQNPSYEDAAELLAAAREAQERTKADARQQIEHVRHTIQTRRSMATDARSSQVSPPPSPETSALRTNRLPLIEEPLAQAPAKVPGTIASDVQPEASAPPAPAPVIVNKATAPLMAPSVTKLDVDQVDSPSDNASVTLSPGSVAVPTASVTSIEATVAQPSEPPSRRRRFPVLPIVAGAVIVLVGALLILRPWQGLSAGLAQTGTATTADVTDVASSATNPAVAAPTDAPAENTAPTIVPDTPQAAAMPEPTGKLVIQDDFSNKAALSGFEDILRATDFSRGFHPPGVYHIIPSQPNTTNWVVLPRMSFRDFNLQIKVWDESDELSGNIFEGIIFRARDMSHFYALLLDPRNGKYIVQKYDGPNTISDLIPWTESPLINRQKEVNQVRIDAQGSTFTIYLNGKQLDSFSDEAYTFGMIGMIASNQDAVKPHPHFDELTIWSNDQPPESEYTGLPTEREDPAGNMVLIPEGEFIMGGNERPDAQNHILYLPSFYIDRTEVTNAAYKQCVAAGKCSPPRQVDSATHPGYYDDPVYDDYPVIYVTWEQARQFCGWANKRLPSEAEWEKSASWNAQESKKVLYPWGNEFNAGLLNSADSNNIDTLKVGSFEPEINGTVDMAGNVSEWTNSLVRPYPYNIEDGREEYPAPGERVFRGASWAQTEGKARVYNRRAAPPDYPDREIGFRCAVSP